jgi:hypothetical protein
MKTHKYIPGISLVLLAIRSMLGSPQSDQRSKCGGSSLEDFSPSLGPKARAFLAGLDDCRKSRRQTEDIDDDAVFPQCECGQRTPSSSE